MSRTDAHRPAWVKYNDPTARDEYRDYHDHTAGVCDLDQYLADSSSSFIRHYCYRVPSGRPRWCSCASCSGEYGESRIRIQRVRWRSLARDFVKVAPEDREDIDEWITPLKALW